MLYCEPCKNRDLADFTQLGIKRDEGHYSGFSRRREGETWEHVNIFYCNKCGRLYADAPGINEGPIYL
jgi:plasmid stabilization system protein ParE